MGMTITITVEDEHKGHRFIADRQITDLEIDYSNFDLVGSIINDLRKEVKAQRDAERPNA
jgi:hypothetical protein